MSTEELVALVCCDLGAIVRGRSLPAAHADEGLGAGVGWVPANHSLTPLGSLADETPFGSTGDLRLLPDTSTRVRVQPGGDAPPLQFVLCDLVETDGRPWNCCTRTFLRDALAELERDFGLRLWSSFEHEFQLLRDMPAELPFSLAAARQAEPFASWLMGALGEAGVEPERFFSEFAPHQYEVPVAAAQGLAGADRAVVVREVVREVARSFGLRASFVPLLDPHGPGNGVHIHIKLLAADGTAALYDAGGEAHMSATGLSFAAGILRHARALSALSAPSPVSGARLAPHHWSAGAACLADRNREALLRIPPLVKLGDDACAAQLRLEYRGSDAAANPYLALGAIVRAGLDGLRSQLPAPAILEVDPSQLDEHDQARFGVGALPATLEDALEALAADRTVRGWLGAALYDAYVGIKRSELRAADGVDVRELCRRYAAIY